MSNDDRIGDRIGTKTDDADQAIQINEHTIDDPEPPERRSDDELHRRCDVPVKDHGQQINDNTIGDKLAVEGDPLARRFDFIKTG